VTFLCGLVVGISLASKFGWINIPGFMCSLGKKRNARPEDSGHTAISNGSWKSTWLHKPSWLLWLRKREKETSDTETGIATTKIGNEERSRHSSLTSDASLVSDATSSEEILSEKLRIGLFESTSAKLEDNIEVREIKISDSKDIEYVTSHSN
jgi:hypothetical protein